MISIVHEERTEPRFGGAAEGRKGHTNCHLDFIARLRYLALVALVALVALLASPIARVATCDL